MAQSSPIPSGAGGETFPSHRRIEAIRRSSPNAATVSDLQRLKGFMESATVEANCRDRLRIG